MSIRSMLQILGGSDPKILARDECQHERLKHEAYGLTVILSGAMAFGAGAALTSVFVPGLPVALLGGVLWSGAMLVIDRSLLVGISPKNSPVATATQVIPRVVLSLAASTLVSIPLEQAIFKGEIDQQLAKTKVAQSQELREQLFTENPELQELKTRFDRTSRELTQMTLERNRAAKEAIAEAEGTSGSLLPGKGELFSEKQQQAKKLDGEVRARQRSVDDLKAKIEKLEAHQEKNVASVTAHSPSGILAGKEALEEIKSAKPEVANIVKFLGILITGIEIAPVAAKLFSPSGVYEEIVASEQQASIGFYSNERELSQKFREFDNDRRLNDQLQLVELMHEAALKEFPKIIESAMDSPEFMATKLRLIEALIGRIERIFEAVAKGTTTTKKEVKEAIEEELSRFRSEYVRQRARADVTEEAIASVAEYTITDPWEE